MAYKKLYQEIPYTTPTFKQNKVTTETEANTELKVTNSELKKIAEELRDLGIIDISAENEIKFSGNLISIEEAYEMAQSSSQYSTEKYYNRAMEFIKNRTITSKAMILLTFDMDYLQSKFIIKNFRSIVDPENLLNIIRRHLKYPSDYVKIKNHYKLLVDTGVISTKISNKTKMLLSTMLAIFAGLSITVYLLVGILTP